jgi:lactate dehydrogenase-like 2-hydroxyacid dehydrogenase
LIGSYNELGRKPMKASEKLPIKTLIFAPLIDKSFGIVSAGCDAIDRRNRLSEFTAEDAARPEMKNVEAVLTTGLVGFQAEHMDLLPNLKIICCFGVGHEGVDLDAAASRGIAVTNAPSTNGDTVADHAVGLLLAVARGMMENDKAARNGEWEKARKIYRPTLNGSTVGIMGLGAIGRAIATRCAAFDASIAYTGRNERPDIPYRFLPDAQSLAAESDFLVIACPGGPATRHLVNAAALKALGPSGILVNIGRGSVIDTPALVHALKNGVIYGAGLDVVDGEPEVPEDLLSAPNLLLTPHMAGRSPIALISQCNRALDNLGRMSRGDELVCRVA